MSVGNSLKHYLWWQKRNSLALAVGCKRMLPRTRIITNNGSESLFVAQKKKKYGASMRLVSRESEYGSLCSGVPSSPSPKSRYKVVLWFLVWQISLIFSYVIFHQDHSVVESLNTPHSDSDKAWLCFWGPKKFYVRKVNFVWARSPCFSVFWGSWKRLTHKARWRFLLDKNEQRLCFSQVVWFDVRISNICKF